MNKIIPIVLVTAVVTGSAAFYGGMKYAQGKNGFGPGQGNFSDLTAEERQQRAQQMGANIGGTVNRAGGGFVSGEIISRDDNSITVKLRDGGSKIVLYSDTTEVGKTATGGLQDLEIGETVTVSGSVNQDGSVTAQSIQIRPTTPVPTQ